MRRIAGSVLFPPFILWSVFSTLALPLWDVRPAHAIQRRALTAPVDRGSAQALTAPGLQVNVFTGNLQLEASDHLDQAPRCLVDFSRTYNSGTAATSGRMGFGWRDHYDIQYRRGTNAVRIFWGDGRQDLFRIIGTAFIAPTGTRLTLTEPVPGVLVLQERDGTTFTFGNPTHRRVTVISTLDGPALTFAYDGMGRLLSVTDVAGRAFTYAYDGAGRILSVTAPQTAPLPTVSFAYDGSGNLASAADAGGGTTIYGYDAQHRMTSARDARGFETDIGYATTPCNTDLARVGVVRTSLSRRDFRYFADLLSTVLIDSIGPSTARSHLRRHDTRGRLVSANDATGSSSTYSWDGQDRLTAVTDPLGHTVNFEYDGLGDLIRVTEAGGGIWNMTYHPASGTPTSITDPLGASRTWVVNPQGNPTSATDRTGAVSTMTWDGFGNLVGFVDALSQSWAIGYDSNSRASSLTDPLGHTHSFARDSAGHVTGIQDPLGSSWGMTRDVNGRVLQVAEPGGATWNFSNDALGNMTSRQDPSGGITTFSYDALGRLQSVTNPLLQTSTYTYDALGRLVHVTDGAGRSRDYQYDAEDRLARAIDGFGAATTYVRNADGQVTSVQRPNGQSTSFTYDANHLHATSAYSTGGVYAATRDAEGRVLSETDTRIPGTFTHAYDGEDRTTSRAWTFAPGATGATYDAVGRLKTLTDPWGGVVTYVYDGAGRLTSVTDPDTRTYLMQYDNANRMTQLETPSGHIVTYSYDGAGRVLSMSWDGGADYRNYGYDARGNLTSETSAAGTATYTYDGADRLIAATYAGGGSESFTYDGAGNRTSRTDPGGTLPCTYDAAGRVLSDGTRTYTYDAAGRLVRAVQAPADTTTYTWDSEGRLLRLGLPGGSAHEFQYEPNGERKVWRPAAGGEVRYVRWGVNVIAETDGGNTVQRRYTVAGVDRILGIKVGATTLDVLQDRLASVLALWEGGTVKAEYRYGAFGTELSSTGPEAASNLHRFTGRERITGTNLYDYRARIYDPDQGRFLSPDPVPGSAFEPVTMNPYVYAGDQPLTYNDPSGEFWFLIVGLVAAAVVIYKAVTYVDKEVAKPLTVLADDKLNNQVAQAAGRPRTGPSPKEVKEAEKKIQETISNLPADALSGMIAAWTAVYGTDPPEDGAETLNWFIGRIKEILKEFGVEPLPHDLDSLKEWFRDKMLDGKTLKSTSSGYNLRSFGGGPSDANPASWQTTVGSPVPPINGVASLWLGRTDTSWPATIGYGNHWDQALIVPVPLGCTHIQFTHLLSSEDPVDKGLVYAGSGPVPVNYAMANFAARPLLGTFSGEVGPAPQAFGATVPASTTWLGFRFVSDERGSSEDAEFPSLGWRVDDIGTNLGGGYGDGPLPGPVLTADPPCVPSAAAVDASGARGDIVLGPIRPHPLEDHATIEFTLDRGGPVVLEVLDLGGRRVAMLLNRTCEPGRHEVRWSRGPKLESGVYFLRLTAGDRRAVRKVVVMR